MNTLTYLKSQVDSTFPTNGIKSITAANVRTFLKNILDGVFTPAGTIRIWAGYTIPSGWSVCDGSELSQTEYADLFANLGGNLSPYGILSTTFKIPLIAPSQNVIQYGISAFTAGYSLQDDTEYTVGDILTASAPIGGASATFKVLSQDLGSGVIQLQIITRGKGFHQGSQPINLTGGSGTGAQIFILSAYDLGSTGGEEKHTLLSSEMPSHTHTQNAHSHTVPYSRSLGPGATADVSQGQSGGANNQNFTSNPTTATNQNTGGGLAHNNMQPYVAMNYIIKLY